MENRSVVSRPIGGSENVRASECTRRFNAKIGQALFQRDDIVGRSRLWKTNGPRIAEKSYNNVDEILNGVKFVFTKQPIKRRVVHATSRTEVINQQLLPPQGFGPEAKTRGGTLGVPACIHTRNSAH